VDEEKLEGEERPKKKKKRQMTMYACKVYDSVNVNPYMVY